MGGILIISSIAITTLLLADLGNFYVRMAVVCLVWLGARRRGRRLAEADEPRPRRQPARRHARQPPGADQSLEKLLFQVGLGVMLAYFTYRYGQRRREPHALFPFFKNVHVLLPIGAVHRSSARWC